MRQAPGRGERASTVQDPVASYGAFRPRGLLAGLVAMTRTSSDRWFGRRRAFFLRSLAMKVLRDRPLDLEALGASMRLYPANNQSEKRLAFTPQYFDAEERAFLAGVLRDDTVFVDVGADVGGYALFVAAHAGPRSRVLAIEPQPDIFERLVFNIRQNSFSSIKALACAVADTDGPVTLFVNPRNRGETSMRLVNAEARGRQVTVQARSLAGLVEEEGLPRIDAMKIDVEGAEGLVLEPFFRDTAPALWPVVLIVEEGHGRGDVDLPALLARCGYRLVRRTAFNVIYQKS